MPQAENRIHVELSPEHAWERWADPEQLAVFLEGMRSVRVDGERWHWVAEIDGQVEEWDSIAELDPPHRISWRAAVHHHVLEVTFTPGNDDEAGTWVDLRRTYDPALRDTSAGLGVTARSVAHDLERFRSLVEEGPASLAGGEDVGHREGPPGDYVISGRRRPVHALPGELVPAVAEVQSRAREADPAGFDETVERSSREQPPPLLQQGSD